jgi:hypothetical protein
MSCAPLAVRAVELMEIEIEVEVGHAGRLNEWSRILRCPNPPVSELYLHLKDLSVRCGTCNSALPGALIRSDKFKAGCIESFSG